MPIEGGAFDGGESGEGFVVFCECREFFKSAAGKVALIEEDIETGAFAVLVFFLFGGESVLGEETCLAGGFDLLVLALEEFNGVVDLDHDVLLEGFVIEDCLGFAGTSCLEAVARGAIAQRDRENDADGMAWIVILREAAKRFCVGGFLSWFKTDGGMAVAAGNVQCGPKLIFEKFQFDVACFQIEAELLEFRAESETAVPAFSEFRMGGNCDEGFNGVDDSIDPGGKVVSDEIFESV